MTTKSRCTQSLANTFPSWSNTRKDEQSLGFQFLNSIGHRFEELNKQLKNNIDNFYLPTAVISDIDVYYKHKLPNTYVFTEDPDNTEFIYVPPIVQATAAGVVYNITIAEKNDIETFWYKAIPTRISITETVTGNHLIATGTVDKSPFSSLVEEMHIPNKLTIKIENGISFLGLYNNGLLRKSIVQITGKTRQGQSVTEEVLFLHNETQQTWHEFKSIETNGIKLYGFEPVDTTEITVTSAAFNKDDYPVNYELDQDLYGDDTPYFWAINKPNPDISRYTLDLKRYDTNDLELRMQGFTTKHTVLSQELLDTSEQNIIPLDLAIEPHSNRIWIVSATKLYLFEEGLPYFDMSLLNKKQYDAHSVIEPNTYYAVLGEEIELNYIWLRPVTGMVAHRAWVLKPDGTTKSLENGEEVTYHTDTPSWIFGEPLERKIRNAEHYILNQRGNYIYSLEVRYADNTTSIDQRIINVCYLKPQAEFTLPNITAVGVDIDSEYKLWVLDSSGDKHQIRLHYDNMLVDFKRKTLYFREPYDKLAIEEL